jgi:hypothetical protein
VPETRMEELDEDEDECGKLLAEHDLGRTGWSVVVRGTLADITDPAHLARLRALPLYPWAPGEKTRYLRVRPASVSGRRIRIPDDLPFAWWG